jgi:stress response protein YsnF
MEPNESTAADGTSPSGSTDEVRLSAVREELAVGVRKVETGAVRVRKLVHEEVQPISIRLHTERIGVTRVPINRPVEHRSEPRHEGDTFIIPVYEYVPVIQMQLTLKEEVHITTTQAQEDVIHQVLMNSEEIVVERREGPDGEWKRDPGSG